MTPAEIIYQRRARVLDHARETGNVAATCRMFGVSRTTFYKWLQLSEGNQRVLLHRARCRLRGMLEQGMRRV